MKTLSADPILAMIDAHQQALNLLASTYRLYRTVAGVPVPDTTVEVQAIAAPLQLPAPKKRQKRIGALRRVPKQSRLPLVPGSLPARIIEVIQEIGVPAKKLAIQPKTGAGMYPFDQALKQLVDGGHVIPMGAKSVRRYGLPGMAS